jgi:hypothetical protein
MQCHLPRAPPRGGSAQRPAAAAVPPRRARTTAAAAAAPATAAARPPTVTPPPPLVQLPPGLADVEFFAPPMAKDPAAMLQQGVPFLTKAAGALPAVPRSLEHALYMYGE